VANDGSMVVGANNGENPNSYTGPGSPSFAPMNPHRPKPVFLGRNPDTRTQLSSSRVRRAGARGEVCGIAGQSDRIASRDAFSTQETRTRQTGFSQPWSEN
jgi:hypothetical protein